MDPAVSPARGVTIYANDRTQGPVCALACPAGTVFRNYLCQGGQGQGETQVDNAADIATLVCPHLGPAQYLTVVSKCG